MSDHTDAKDALKAAETALKEAIARQAQLEMLHSQSIAEIVHDLKNPLTAMLGYLAMLKNEVSGPIEPPQYKGFVETLDRSAHRLLDVCNSLLGEHAGFSGPAKRPKTVQITDLVDEIHDMFAAKAKERGISLSSEVADDFPTLVGDPQDMYRALMNLVSNAIKFTPEGGNVAINTEVDPKDNTFVMVVRDSGVGMTRDQVEKIKSGTVSTVSPHGDIGTGQGLGIVNSMVESLGGKLDIISTENRGTKIKMEFPNTLSRR
ncbi:HAMP domain-containing sensor histidine kinase [Magnetovibrio sp. PR-2]|uniref:sensor histidine kinase n=1 Tax=Magnetovibrio sp. PR-2 TaxID=3120356 RepID=UPI002FCE56DE